VLVGTDEKEFILYISIATARSNFFKAACTGSFKEAEEKIVRLPEADVDVFESYVQWIYSGEIVVLEADELANDKDGGFLRRKMIRLYGLADALMDIVLQNKITDNYIASCKFTNMGPSLDDIDWAYEHTLDRCTL
jgi:hypothetical protein